ncbi:MAG: Hsp33 family molecular chaperone HslO [Pseudomonadales bacterium]|nr:Hsp33 family molecular chaperone HslO [Pseudomonadales bacterium]
MQSTDISQRFIFDHADIRGELVTLGDSYLQTVAQHGYTGAVSQLLGQFLAAGVLLGSTIKFAGRLVLQARGDGDIDLIMSEYTSEGNLRGIARFAQQPKGNSFRELVGKGTLVITVDSRLGDPYQGVVALDSDSLALCLQHYFQQSEQLDSWFMLAVDEKRVSAMMLQQLPAQLEADPEVRAEQWQQALHLARTLSRDELLSHDHETILHRLYHEQDLRLFEPRPLRYQCSCSRERTAKALLAIGKQEVDSIVAEQNGVEISCEFCGTEYNFGPGELELLFTKAGLEH